MIEVLGKIFNVQLPGFKSEGGRKTWVFIEKSHQRHMCESSPGRV